MAEDNAGIVVTYVEADVPGLMHPWRDRYLHTVVAWPFVAGMEALEDVAPHIVLGWSKVRRTALLVAVGMALDVDDGVVDSPVPKAAK